MKRSAMPQRTKPLVRASGPARGEIRPKRCKACRGDFFPASSWQTHCRQEACAVAAAEAAHEKRAKTLRKQSQAERKADRAAKEAMKGVPELKREAQTAFNAWVRMRDAHQPCISCGAPPPDLSALHAGRDAGHYRSTGAADHLRFHPDNCHAQCVSCNQHKAGNVVMYRLGLIARIGLQRVEALESDNTPTKWTRDGLRMIRDEYRAKLKELRAAQ